MVFRMMIASAVFQNDVQGRIMRRWDVRIFFRLILILLSMVACREGYEFTDDKIVFLTSLDYCNF